MVITVFPFMKMTVTSPLSSHHGDAIIMKLLRSDVQNMTKCVDDPLLWSDDLQSSFFQAVGWLNLCGCNVMASPSTQKSSSLGRKKSFLQDLK